MASLKELLGAIRYPNKEKIDLITKAYHFAEKAHAGQKRYSGEPYFTHVAETAMILAELGMGRRTISAGLLHDVIEDAKISPEELTKHFGKEIVFLVEGVTKLGTIRYKGEERHVESLRKFFVAMSHDIRVIIIKLADRLHNMRTLEYIPEEKQRRIAMETMEIYIPLAYRLGIRKLKREMEDLAFKYIDPQRFEELKKAIKESAPEKEKKLEKFRKFLLKMVEKENMSEVESDMRVKSIYSVHRKIIQKHRDIDKIYDMHALRMQVKNAADCYKMLGIIHGIWRPLPGRIKDYIAFPKPNGYQSLHTTVFTGDGDILEVQIRTHDMHRNAEYGFAAHISYKEWDTGIQDPHYTWFKQFFSGRAKKHPAPVAVDKERMKHIPQWITELVDVQSYINIPTEFMENLRSDFFEHRMFIFDPKGEVIDLPIGSSIIDYAYAMDAKSGNKLFSARVHDKIASLNTILKNGDIVNIITQPNAKPTKKWLEYCRTANAKKHIRDALTKQEKKANIKRQNS